jgi:branched-chain amino acid transport system ATP-binding protein
MTMMNTTGIGPLLELKEVRAAYVKKEILRGVSLTVNRGEIVALLGGNGSGKSTLLKTIAGLLQPIKGRIEFKGRDITQLSVHGRQKGGIGYLLQGGRVFPNLSVEENFEIAMKHHRNGHNGNGVKLGSIFPPLREKTNVRAGLLSGGQRQMLAIEMVLAQEPELALLDEPTGALSHDLAITILKTLSDYVRQTQCGVLLVEQNVEEASKVSHRQLSLREGITDAMSLNGISRAQKAVTNPMPSITAE